MSRKFSDLDADEKKNIEEQLEGISSTLGMDAWESQGTSGLNKMKEQVGMCYNCKHLNYCKTEFGKVHAICNHFEFKLTGQNRITECNCHSPKNVLSLTEMYAMAYLIDPSEEKIEGFISNNPKLRKKGLQVMADMPH